MSSLQADPRKSRSAYWFVGSRLIERDHTLSIHTQQQSLLLFANPSDSDLARDLVAAVLTQNHGEYVFRIGQQPSHTELFGGDLNDQSPDWSGIARTVEDLDKLREQFTKVVEEVGGKVRFFLTSSKSKQIISNVL